jgi:hypothetical protein
MNDPSQVVTTTSEVVELLSNWKWPIAIIIILLIFRKPIVDLFNKITKIGYGQSSLEIQQSKAEKQQIKKISKVEKALGIFRSETLDFFRNAVVQETELDNAVNDAEKIERLTNYSIALYIIKNFEYIYNLIFGSQILILQQLNTLVHEDKTSLKRYYDYAKNSNPGFFETYSYEQYLSFLFVAGLIKEEDGRIIITLYGNDFLKYLIETSKDMSKYN